MESEAFDEYMLYGGMPGLVNEPTPERKRAYLKDLYDEIYIKDLVEHARIQREDVLENMLDYLASQIGSLTNASKITGALNIKLTTKITDDTVSKYLKHTMDAFLISETKRYDVKGKKYFEYPVKYYCEDIGLRNVRLNLRQQEETHIMENIIYNELRFRGYLVDVGVVEVTETDEDGKRHQKQYEIDFIVNKGSKKYYIQSMLRAGTKEKEEQEKKSLKNSGDFFKKIIVSKTTMKPWTDDEGILHIGLYDFLLREDALEA